VHHQTISLSLGLDDRGAMAITASTWGTSVVVALDSSKLRLFARPYDTRGTVARERRMVASIGQARRTRSEIASISEPPHYAQSLSVPVNLSGPPGPPGIYDVWVRALDGFATASDGTAVPLEQRTGAFRVWWPDESGNDRELARLRSELVGRVIYGYGGIAISCRPGWTKFYGASTPVRVRSIERKRGHITWLGTGSRVSDPYVVGVAFIAFDPLSIIVQEPSSARYPPLGTNYSVGGAVKPCPEFELADWQLDTTLSLHPPPTGVDLECPLYIGMTRDEVVWTRGYPNEVGMRAALRAESTWQYGPGSTRYTVTFIRNRVVSFTIPRGT
jgi:hypothetical protein